MTGLAPNQLEGEQTVGLARQLLLQYHKAQIHTQLTKDTSSQLSQTGEGEHWKAKKKNSQETRQTFSLLNSTLPDPRCRPCLPQSTSSHRECDLEVRNWSLNSALQ